MGGMLSQPVTKKRSNKGEGLGLRYAVSSMQGWRPEMEDAHDVKIGLKYGLNDWSFFAVFDGHAGKRAAAFAACNLSEYILRDSQFELGTENLTEPFYIEPPEDSSNSESIQDEPSSKTSVSDSNGEDKKSNPESPSTKSDDCSDKREKQEFSKCSPPHKTSGTSQDEKTTSETELDQDKSEEKPLFVSLPIIKQLDMVQNAIKSGFLKIDQSMRITAQDTSGCTAVCAFVSPTHIFIANCGDSRAVLYGRTSIRFFSDDHKPFKPNERVRILNAGGTATQRINGTLAVSRALGDFEFKKDPLRGPCEQLVSPEPEVTIIERDSDDEFLILACDGIWDVMTNDDLCSFICHMLRIESDIEKICSSVLDVCLRKGSRDNMSIILVVFGNDPKIDKQAVSQEEENDYHLLQKARSLLGVIERPSNFPTFFAELKDELSASTQHLPPGAGIEAKYDMFQEEFEHLFEENSE